MRRPTLLTLLSLALVLALWAAPGFAQAAPSPAAPAPAVAAPAQTAPTPAVAVPAAPAFALAGVATEGSTCASTSPFPAPSIFCYVCPPGYAQCGGPGFCRCCPGI